MIKKRYNVSQLYKGDNMQEVVWKLFKKTGNIKYYLLAKKLEGDNDANKKDNWNSNKRSKLQ